MGVSYTSHLLDLLVAAPQPLVTKVDSVMARLQARIKQSLQVRITSSQDKCVNHDHLV